MAFTASSSGFTRLVVQRESLERQPRLNGKQRFRMNRTGAPTRLQVSGSSSGDLVTSNGNKKAMPYASYAVPIDSSSGSSFITRPLAEILRDMNKRVPDKVIKVKVDEDGNELKYIPWFHANRMLSFYAPGWSGEVRSLSFSPDSKTVTVVYRVTIRGSDGEISREASGTAYMNDVETGDPVQAAEGMAFRRSCARFGLGLYLYHEDDSQ